MDKKRFIFRKKFIKRGNSVIVDDTKTFFMDFINASIQFSAMKHPNEWAISKLRVDERLHYIFSLFYPHVIGNS